MQGDFNLKKQESDQVPSGSRPESGRNFLAINQNDFLFLNTKPHISQAPVVQAFLFYQS